MKIIIDAGHGPETPGKRTPDDSMREFHFNSRVADLLNAALLEYEGVETMLPHNPGRDIPLDVRTRAANNWKADLFLSIHANAAGSGGWSQAHGIETYVYKTKPAEAYALAAEIQNQLIRETGRHNRGVKTADFHVLRETSMTAVLVECGFMTNREEAALLKSESYRQKVAKALEQAIVKHYQLSKTAPQPVGTPILGPASATVAQAMAWARANDAPAAFVALAPLVWEIAPQRGSVDPAVQYVQFAHETGFLYRDGKSMAGIDASYHNPCGLKVTEGGSDTDSSAHKRFADWREGLTAQADHLALYAGATGYPRTDTPDPRHFDWIAGKVKTVEALGGKGKWAPSETYGLRLAEKLKQLQATKPERDPDAPVTWGELEKYLSEKGLI